jgi:hypothetical protein
MKIICLLATLFISNAIYASKYDISYIVIKKDINVNELAHDPEDSDLTSYVKHLTFDYNEKIVCRLYLISEQPIVIKAGTKLALHPIVINWYEPYRNYTYSHWDVSIPNVTYVTTYADSEFLCAKNASTSFTKIKFKELKQLAPDTLSFIK